MTTPRPASAVGWLPMVAAISLILAGLGWTCWALMPQICPGWVFAYSPWVEPRLRALAVSHRGPLTPQLVAWGQGDLPGLIRCARHRRPEIRVLATTMLGQFTDSEAVAAMVRAMKDADQDVRMVAVLWCPSDSLIARAAIEAALDDPSTDIRCMAIERIASYRDRAAIEQLLRVMRDSGEPMHEAAATALFSLDLDEEQQRRYDAWRKAGLR
jgi:HEAT repeat protein